MYLGSLLVATAALIVSILSFYFSIKSWRETNRPLITVRTTSFGSGGNVSIPLSLLVENTGNRPAKNVRLTVDAADLDAALVAPPGDVLRKHVESCFSDRGIIPVLANGRNVSNGFGFLSADKPTWKIHSRFEVDVTYQGADDTQYKHKIPLLIADDAGFAGGHWSSPE
jgi:hypothetical protein